MFPGLGVYPQNARQTLEVGGRLSSLPDILQESNMLKCSNHIPWQLKEAGTVVRMLQKESITERFFKRKQISGFSNRC